MKKNTKTTKIILGGITFKGMFQTFLLDHALWWKELLHSKPSGQIIIVWEVGIFLLFPLSYSDEHFRPDESGLSQDDPCHHPQFMKVM